MTASEEEWRPVVGYEGYYEVSDHGRVRGVDRDILRTRGTYRRRGKVLAAHLNTSGRPAVPLYRDGSHRTHTIHTLVLEAFVGARPVGMFGCHADDNPLNNIPSNLRWDTPSQNNHDAVRHGLHPQAKKEHCIRGHQLREANLRILPPAKEGNQPRRNCVACSRAGVNVRAAAKRGIVLDFNEAATRAYRKIMKE